MKKIIYSMMALAMTTTVFTSCEDVPAPYSVTFEENNNTNTNTPTTPATGTGTEADPFNVAAALKYIDAGQNLIRRYMFLVQSLVSRRLMLPTMVMLPILSLTMERPTDS